MKTFKVIRFLIFASGLLSALSACSENKTRQKENPASNEKTSVWKKDNPENSYAGTYTFGDDVEKGAIGKIQIYPITRNSAIFYIDVNRGAPSYNFGNLLGEITIDENGIASFKSKDEYIDCSLNFQFTESTLKISTDEKQDKCGFGHAVYADHEYVKSDKSIPQFFINGEGDSTYFESLLRN